MQKQTQVALVARSQQRWLINKLNLTTLRYAIKALRTNQREFAIRIYANKGVRQTSHWRYVTVISM